MKDEKSRRGAASAAAVRGRIIFKAGLALALAAILHASTQVDTPELAARTGLGPSLSITDYDISLRTALESDTLSLVVTCRLRNDTAAPVDLVDFDLFAREQYYGVKVDIAGIGRVTEGRLLPLKYSRAASPRPASMRARSKSGLV